MINVVNLTPHEVNLGGHVFPPSGQVARVSTSYKVVGWLTPPVVGFTLGDEESHSQTIPVIPVYRAVFGEVTGLPKPESGTHFLVSGMVAAACPDRADVFSPATGHPEVVRVAGQVASVPGLVCTPAF